MATMESVMENITRLLSAKVEGDMEITPDTNIVADTGLDSVSVMDFVFEIEDEFGISVPMESIADVKTVKDLAAAVHALVSKAA